MVGFVHYHNTITIPNDENWIVQGRVDPVSGLPSSLDGRLKSGNAVDRSHASIVLRHLRISGQVAPVSTNPIPRASWVSDQFGGFGGAFEYDGGSDDPENLAKIIFVEVVFDHNAASSLAAVDINGRGGHPGGPNPETQTWESGIELTISGCTFFRNYATYAYGAMSVMDIWP